MMSAHLDLGTIGLKYNQLIWLNIFSPLSCGSVKVKLQRRCVCGGIAFTWVWHFDLSIMDKNNDRELKDFAKDPQNIIQATYRMGGLLV